MNNNQANQAAAVSDNAAQPAAASTSSKKVEIYSTPTCHYCQMAKEFFKDKGVAYTEYNVAEDADKRAEMVEKTQQVGVPVIAVTDPANPEDDGQIIIGFDQGALEEMLQIKA